MGSISVIEDSWNTTLLFDTIGSHRSTFKVTYSNRHYNSHRYYNSSTVTQWKELKSAIKERLHGFSLQLTSHQNEDYDWSCKWTLAIKQQDFVVSYVLAYDEDSRFKNHSDEVLAEHRMPIDCHESNLLAMCDNVIKLYQDQMTKFLAI